MLNNTKILLTIYLGGKLASCTARKLQKSLKRRVMSSSFERYDEESGTYITPERHFKAHNDFVPTENSECVQKVKITELQYDAFTNPEYYPGKFDHKKGRLMWASLTDEQRLHWHLNAIAEGKLFNYQVV